MTRSRAGNRSEFSSEPAPFTMRSSTCRFCVSTERPSVSKERPRVEADDVDPSQLHFNLGTTDHIPPSQGRVQRQAVMHFVSTHRRSECVCMLDALRCRLDFRTHLVLRFRPLRPTARHAHAGPSPSARRSAAQVTRSRRSACPVLSRAGTAARRAALAWLVDFRRVNLEAQLNRRRRDTRYHVYHTHSHVHPLRRPCSCCATCPCAYRKDRRQHLLATLAHGRRVEILPRGRRFHVLASRYAGSFRQRRQRPQRGWSATLDPRGRLLIWRDTDFRGQRRTVTARTQVICWTCSVAFDAHTSRLR